MTDHRDAPRLRATEPTPGVGGRDAAATSLPGDRPFARLMAAHPAGRRLSLRRLATWLGPGAGAVLVLVVLGIQSFRAAFDWLARQPAYQVPFAALTLDPAPPGWIRSGGRGLLDVVRRRSNRPEILSSLAVDLGQLAADFQRESPWVRAVREVVVPDRNHVVVRLEYREPVARLELGAGRRVAVDRDGVVLPGDDLDLQAAGPLIRLVGFVPPGATVVPLAGRSLIVEPAGSGPVADWRAPFQAAARLAAFLRARPEGAPAILAIHNHSGHLFLEAEGGAMILWSPLPGAERPGAPTDAERWALLRLWLKDHRLRDLQNPDFLDFERDRAVIRHPRAL